MDLLEERQTKGFSAVALGPAVACRMQFLDEPDRKLLEMTLTGRLTRREAGLLLGLNTGTVSRRVRRILARLHHPAVVALVEAGQLLPEGYREVGLAHFLRAQPIRRIARDHALSQHAVRKIVQYVQGWAAPGRAPPKKG